MILRFSATADKQLQELLAQVSDRILSKLEWFALQKEPLHFAKALTGIPGKFRFRIREYRVIVMPDGTILGVLRVQKRSEVYRRGGTL